MGIHRGPNLVKDGLVFGYDTGYGVADNNTATRFYPGEATENGITTPDFSSGASPYNTHSASLTGKVLKITLTGVNSSNRAQFTHNTSFNTPQTATMSIYAKGEGSTVGKYLQTYSGASWTTGIGPLTSEFKRFNATITTGGGSGGPGNIGLQSGVTGDVFYIHSPQLEANSHATPFIDGTRSSTASLIDLKETTDIDVSNVSFDSTGQPEFDGTNDYIQNSSYTSHQKSTGTLEVVIKPTIISGNRYIAGVGGTTTYGATRTIRINGGTLGIVTYGSSTQDWGGVTAAIANQYQHVVATWSGTSLQMYVNNVFYSATKTGVVSPLGTNITIGRPPWSSGSYSAGSVDIFKHYNRVLSATEVKQNYNAYKNRFNI